jgi:hypothetical protein
MSSKLVKFAEDNGPTLAPFQDHNGFPMHDALRVDLREALAAMTIFCERVELGEIRSKRTYAAFNKILGRKQ